MILARFRDMDSLKHAAKRARDECHGDVEMFTPYLPIDSGPDTESSRVPLVVLLVGLFGAAAFFLLQTWSQVWSYPFNTGGKPDFSWPAYVGNAFEVGILMAMVAGLVSFLIASRMPRLYHPVDRFFMFHEASRDGYFLLIETRHPEQDRAFLETLHPIRIEEME